jgi:SAM-dependent methyltransferase
MDCNICSTALNEAVYESEASLTSLCEIFPQPTRVRLCAHCGHLQTDEIDDAASFYDTDYSILTDSEEEDQIYEVRDGRKIYRTEHQIEVLVEKLGLEPETRILDYGCAKSSMMRLLLEKDPRIDPHLYDVSDRYVPFWEKFLHPSRWATYDVPDAWHGYFDLITSFFALEHITRPTEVVGQIARLLKPGGLFYGIVPNVLTNSADLIVIDHVNHFTRSSLDCLLTSAALEIRDVDADVHRGAFVFIARRSADDAITTTWSADAREIAAVSSELRELAGFWAGAAERLRDAEQRVAGNGDVAVYGAGFYGAFIKCCLAEPERIRCFIDQNPYLQGRELDGAPIIAPDDLPGDIHNVFVGLNPANANRIIASVDAFATRDLAYFYI